ncbi:MAG: hypothetical protein M1830_006404, partial [Pleopsidium flavum]
MPNNEIVILGISTFGFAPPVNAKTLDPEAVAVGPTGPKPDKMTPPISTLLPVVRGIVLVPMTRDPDGANDTGVPDMVTPGPPAERVVPSMRKF